MMILVEVMVPSLGRRYDFELEESVTVDLLIREMVTVICQKEHCQCFAGEQGISLYSAAGQYRLVPQATPQQNGIRNGQRLILV